jgi:hypothetical protein
MSKKGSLSTPTHPHAGSLDSTQSLDSNTSTRAPHMSFLSSMVVLPLQFQVQFGKLTAGYAYFRRRKIIYQFLIVYF